MLQRFNHFFISVRVGWFLAIRQLKRSSKWTTVLITFVMTLTFLNLVVVTGILVGLIEGSSRAFRAQYSGDILIISNEDKDYIERSTDFINRAKSLPQVESLTARYLKGGTVEANYQTKSREIDAVDNTGSNITGINPTMEDETTNLKSLLVEGEYLTDQDFDQVLVGSRLLAKYFTGPEFLSLSNVGLGDKIRIKVNGQTREVTIKGVVKSKIDDVGGRVYFVDSQLRGMLGRTDYNVGEIAIKLKPNVDPLEVKVILQQGGLGEFARVQTWQESQGEFFRQISSTFQLLGNFLGSISLVVASITIFIVIFVNAITRRKYIGIMKGIGISSQAIEISYILQSIFYAVVGSAVGLVILYGLLQPFVAAHPINFPFSDGILVAPLGGTSIRVLLLLVTTVIAGFIPARMIIRRNTLDAILGR
ncbi:MAG: FtsX-like permease family protein [Candidatus Vogelbacteria bacterium]|nr:FtsX-like permease family protein [Candidatus Vogelbacteria bacterium]